MSSGDTAFCPYCGSQVGATQYACGSCGSVLQPETTPVDSTQQAPAAAGRSMGAAPRLVLVAVAILSLIAIPLTSGPSGAVPLSDWVVTDQMSGECAGILDDFGDYLRIDASNGRLSATSSNDYEEGAGRYRVDDDGNVIRVERDGVLSGFRGLGLVPGREVRFSMEMDDYNFWRLDVTAQTSGDGLSGEIYFDDGYTLFDGSCSAVFGESAGER